MWQEGFSYRGIIIEGSDQLFFILRQTLELDNSDISVINKPLVEIVWTVFTKVFIRW